MFQYVSVSFGVVHFASHVVQGLKGLCEIFAFFVKWVKCSVRMLQMSAAGSERWRVGRG